MSFAEPKYVENKDDCWFYHVMDLPGIGTVGDSWDLRGRITDYTGGVELAGRRVLDVGTASGFLTFEMERQRAEVVSFDADSPLRSFLLPMRGGMFTENRQHWADHYEGVLRKLNNSYWLAHRLYGSRARVCYGDVYDIPADIGNFDIALVGQILVHLSDPVRALSSIMDRCRDYIIITEGMLDRDEPVAALCARARDRNPWSWWHYSIGLYREIFALAGWKIERVNRAKYRCIASGSPPQIELTTIVARRLP